MESGPFDETHLYQFIWQQFQQAWENSVPRSSPGDNGLILEDSPPITFSVILMIFIALPVQGCSIPCQFPESMNYRKIPNIFPNNTMQVAPSTAG
jgi:hypothetical protein